MMGLAEKRQTLRRQQIAKDRNAERRPELRASALRQFKRHDGDCRRKIGPTQL
jgi:hypothetical protein